jgi:hypothetical protein
MVKSLQDEHAAGTGLLPDFVLDAGGNPRPAGPNFLENAADGAYAMNACRDPWRIGLHFVTTGDGRARTALRKIDAFVRGETGGDPTAIRAGYTLEGSPLPTSNYLSMAFVAPLAVGAMAGDDQTWLNALWDVVAERDDGGYYEDTLRLLAMLALSGNWWAPESAPCPQ